MGTDDDSLIRVIVTRCEIDMVQIKEAFKAEYEETLGNFIKVRLTFCAFYLLFDLIGHAKLSSEFPFRMTPRVTIGWHYLP